jgi:hypothetical protein
VAGFPRAHALGYILPPLRGYAIIFFILLSFGSSPAPCIETQAAEAPLVGRKEPFCGAIGPGRFTVTTSATPTQVQAGDPISFTIRIEAIGSWQHAPLRPALKQKPEYSKFRQRFFVENGQERLSPEQGKWEFDYFLRPKNERVKLIPSLLIVYFRPGLTPAEKGYMTTDAPAISLQVTSRAKVEANEIQGKTERTQPPDRFYDIITGPIVMRNETKTLPNTWVVILLVFCPPALSLGWYVGWRHYNPDAARRTRLQKSKAARQALRALQAVNGKEPRHAARRVAELFEEYLRQRFELTQGPSASSPLNAVIQSGQDRLPTNLAAQAAELFRACDLIQYSPPPIPNGTDLTEKAISLILDVESRP